MSQVSLLQVLERAMSAAERRQQLIANNIANVDTPGYKRFDISLREAMHPRGIRRPLEHHVRREQHTSLRVDGNNVDIDREMANAASNSLYYNAMSTSLNRQLSLMRYLINEGKR